MAFKFEKLTVWQRSLDLADHINLLTKSFPKDELYVLTSQIRRAADSICLILQKEVQDKVMQSI